MVGGPNPVVVYKGNILQSLNCNVIDMPWGERPPGEKGFPLEPGNKQQIGAWIIFGGKCEILNNLMFLLGFNGFISLGPLPICKWLKVGLFR